MKEEKIIMFDSEEAATYRTDIKGWVSSDGIYFGNDEQNARFSGCTHKICECGKQVRKYYTKCDDCRYKAQREMYLAKQYKEFNEFNDAVTVLWDNDIYFYSEDDILQYMEDEDLTELDLLFCIPVKYAYIDSYDYWGDVLPEDKEIPKELDKAIEDINKLIDSLGPASYVPGNIRTTYKV